MFIYWYLFCFCLDAYPLQRNIMGTVDESWITTTTKSRPTVQENQKVFFVVFFFTSHVCRLRFFKEKKGWHCICCIHSPVGSITSQRIPLDTKKNTRSLTFVFVVYKTCSAVKDGGKVQILRVISVTGSLDSHRCFVK